MASSFPRTRPDPSEDYERFRAIKGIKKDKTSKESYTGCRECKNGHINIREQGFFSERKGRSLNQQYRST